MVKKAKKLAKKKPEARGRAPKKSTIKAGPAKRRVAPAPKRPNTTPLPGMEDMSKLSRPMLRIMDTMADVMHRQNTDAATIKGLVNNALDQMKRDNVTVAKAHGIELVRVPGEEKLRKRLLDEGSGSSDDAEDVPFGTERDDSLDNGDTDALNELAEEESLANA